MQLTRKQIDQLGQMSREHFVLRLVQQVRLDWPEEVAVMGHERAERAVRLAVNTALRHGLDTEFDIARLVLLVFAHRSMQFLAEPWAVEHLQGEGPPRERMNHLFDAAMATLPN